MYDFMSRLKPRPTKHALSTGLENFAGPARNELLRFSRNADRDTEQRAGRCVRMCHASRMRSPAQRIGNPLRPAALLEQRDSIRNSQDVRARTDRCQSIGPGFVAAAFRPPAFWGSAEAPANVHTQRFAFRAREEDHESVKMPTTTSRRASAVTRALLSARSQLERAKNANFYSIQMNAFHE